MSFGLAFVAFITVCVICRQFVNSYYDSIDPRYKRMTSKLNDIQKQIY